MFVTLINPEMKAKKNKLKASITSIINWKSSRAMEGDLVTKHIYTHTYFIGSVCEAQDSISNMEGTKGTCIFVCLHVCLF